MHVYVVRAVLTMGWTPGRGFAVLLNAAAEAHAQNSKISCSAALRMCWNNVIMHFCQFERLSRTRNPGTRSYRRGRGLRDLRDSEKRRNPK